MAEILLLTNSRDPLASLLPALDLLPHQVKLLPVEASIVVDAPPGDLILLDARTDLAAARATARLLTTTGLSMPLLLIVTEGGLMALSAEWGARDFILVSAGPAEVEARLRLAMTAVTAADVGFESEQIVSGDLAIDPVAYTVRLRRRHLDLTYKEFELLRHLAQHPGRVFTRTQLLQEVWGYDYYGGTRTVDVHVRRLRAKLGVEYEAIISTIRNVGYRFDDLPERRISSDTGLKDPAPNLVTGAKVEGDAGSR